MTAAGHPVAVVTGGGRGIGAGISKALARHGFHVVIGWTSDEAAAKQTAVDIEEAGSTRAVLVRGDVSDQHTSADLATAAVAEFGRLDCWVNNAGYLEAGSILTLTGDQLRRCFEINVLGTFYGIQSAVEAMRSSGGLEPSDSGKGAGGRIINISSEAGIRAWPLYGAYAPSKFAQIGHGQVAALELGAMGITVNTVCPGMIETDMVLSKWATESAITGTSIDQIRADVTAETLTGALCTPEDVGEAVAWLASPAAKNVTGQSICVNAGVTLH